MAAGQRPVAIRQKGHAADQIVVTHHAAELGPEIEVPEDQDAVGMPRQRSMAQARAGDAEDRARRLQATDPLAGPEVPKPQRPVITTRQDGVVASRRQGNDRAFTC